MLRGDPLLSCFHYYGIRNGGPFDPLRRPQLVHATAVARASGTASSGEVLCIGTLSDFALGPLRRLRVEAQSGQRAATMFLQTFVDGIGRLCIMSDVGFIVTGS